MLDRAPLCRFRLQLSRRSPPRPPIPRVQKTVPAAENALQLVPNQVQVAHLSPSPLHF